MNSYSVKKKLVGKEIEIVLHDIDEVIGEIVVENAYQEALRLENIFNIFDESSELSILNKKRKIKSSNEILEVIKKAIEFCELTDGDYDITLGKQFNARKKGEKEPILKCSFRDIKIENNTITLNHPDIQIDLGSIAKGYIADKMIEILRSEGIISGYVDARGDIGVFGEVPQKISIQHPREKDKEASSIMLINGGIATSGDYNQYTNTLDNCHIINAKELSSATVVAENVMDADIFATLLFVLNKEKRQALLDKYSSIKAMTIDKEMNIAYYNGFEELKNEK